MNPNPYIYLFIGESGSGKTTLCEELANRGYKQLWSYTTRPRRYPEEGGHIFIKQFLQDTQCVAYTEFDGYLYWATPEQVDECDTYVVDPAGLTYFLNVYHGPKKPIVFFIDTNTRTRRRRMKKRGDAKEAIRRRLQHDKKEFATFRKRVYACDPDLPPVFIIDNNTDNGDGLKTVQNYLAFFEEGDLDPYIV